MSKIVMFLGGVLLLTVLSGCKALVPMDPPQPRKEVLCEAWNSMPAAKAQVKNEKKAENNSKAKSSRMMKVQKDKQRAK